MGVPYSFIGSVAPTELNGLYGSNYKRPSSRFIRSTFAVSSAIYRSFRSHSPSRASALAVSFAARSKFSLYHCSELTKCASKVSRYLTLDGWVTEWEIESKFNFVLVGELSPIYRR